MHFPAVYRLKVSLALCSLTVTSLVAVTLGVSPVPTVCANSVFPLLGNEPTPESPISAEKMSDSAATSAHARVMLAFRLSYRAGMSMIQVHSAHGSRTTAIFHSNGGVLLRLLVLVLAF